MTDTNDTTPEAPKRPTKNDSAADWQRYVGDLVDFDEGFGDFLFEDGTKEENIDSVDAYEAWVENPVVHVTPADEPAEEGQDTSPPDVDAPTIGRIVLYRSKANPYEVPAIVVAAADSIWQPAVEAGTIQALTSDLHVHLQVFSPGPGYGYGELNVPHHTLVDHRAGTWRWPLGDDAPMGDDRKKDVSA